jgi:hypothetical protein
LQGWQEIDAIVRSYQGVTVEALEALLEASLLVERDTENARREEEYLACWNWGIPAAMLHFCLQDAEFMPLEAAEQLQVAKSSETASPALHLENAGRLTPSSRSHPGSPRVANWPTSWPVAAPCANAMKPPS